MAQSIRLDTVRKEFKTLGQTHVAVDDVSLEIPAGSFTTLVGPSGCGKTTTLRMLAGLETPTSGRIHFGDDDVTDLPPQKRNVSMVFQSIALYPHMSVRENIGYGLKIHGVPKAERDEKIEEAARVLQIEEQLEKMPAELSGGQQQRVALGGAFVQDPEVLLLDEPMSDLDAKLKSELRVEIQRLHQELDTTIVYVTHDQTEAMTMSDRVVLLREGHVAQFDPPRTLFHRPQSAYVASFIGTPSTNLLTCSVTSVDGVPTIEGHGIRMPAGEALSAHVGNSVTLGIRPQYLRPSGGEIRFEVTAEVVEPLGTESVVHAKTADGTRVDVVSPEVDDARPGDSIIVGFDRDDCYVFAADGETICFGDDLEANPTQLP
ncbi:MULTISPECIES: ABC transporter ATP-binding protein [unclassified Haladaptatus]|uniref:ABC transporter ATP-binding protein n=1 Tax=unclassified Haladaptatus TaxID=2622732 RepID=UPI0023E7A789|nr:MULTISPECIES: ABC transporter ATP-binding protein [unclassified Haladaptatus]